MRTWSRIFPYQVLTEIPRPETVAPEVVTLAPADVAPVPAVAAFETALCAAETSPTETSETPQKAVIFLGKESKMIGDIMEIIRKIEINFIVLFLTFIFLLYNFSFKSSIFDLLYL